MEDSTSTNDSVERAKDRLRQGERLWLPEATDPEWSRYGKEKVDPEKVSVDPAICGTIVERTMVVTDYDDLSTGGKKLAPAVVIHLDPEYRTEGLSDYLRAPGTGRSTATCSRSHAPETGSGSPSPGSRRHAIRARSRTARSGPRTSRCRPHPRPRNSNAAPLSPATIPRHRKRSWTMAPWPFDTERERGDSPLSLHPDDPPPSVQTAAQLALWQALLEFEGLDPHA